MHSVPTDPRGLRSDAPLLDAWLRQREHPPTPFTIPGHKQRTDLVGDLLFSEGDTIVLLESMKMEIPVLADRSGRVLEVKVAAGDVVQEGEVLVVIDD